MTEVSPTYIDRFNAAARLAREHLYEEALAAYDRVFSPLPDGAVPSVTVRFRGLVEMRRAWVLMDLRRYAEARIGHERIHAEYLDHFTEADKQEFWFSYGHTLAQLREDGFVDAFENAIAISEHSLRDLALIERGWMGLLECLEHTRHWEELDWKVHVCHREGIRLGSVRLQLLAGEFAPKAWRGLGDVVRAANGARKIIARLEAAKIGGQRLHEWQAFLRSVSASA